MPVATAARLEQAIAYRERRLPGAAAAVADAADLLAAAATGEPDEPRRRAPSISLDGTPLVLSGGPGGPHAPLRLLADPGGLARDVPEQADFALTTLDALLGTLGWRAAAGDVNALMAAVLPPTVEEARRLSDGAWLGLAAGPELVELRIYLDLRLGSELERWGRVARAFAPFGDDDTLVALRALAERVREHAIPVGLGAVLAGGELRGLRLYAGLEAPDQVSLAGVGAADAVAVCRELGPFEPQSVTAGFDFACRDGGALRGPGRTKVDVACLDRDPESVLAAVAALAGAAGLDPDAVPAFLADVDDCFGGWLLQYVSLGPGQITAYAQPA